MDSTPAALTKLQELRRDLRLEFPLQSETPNHVFQQAERAERADVKRLLKHLLLDIADGMERDDDYAVHFVNRGKWENTLFDPRVGVRLVDQPVMLRVSEERLETVAQVLVQLLRVLDSGQRATKRDHMYNLPGVSQDKLDGIIDDIGATCRVPRISLNTISSSEGLVFGDLRISLTESQVLCHNEGLIPVSVPTACSDITLMQSSADFVLVVEKDTVFQRLLAQTRGLNCILVTGKGYPDLPTRRFVNLLFQFLRIPVLALVDGDPHGAEIMSIYRFGSLSHAYDSRQLACPQMRWIGFLPSDFPSVQFKSHKVPLEPVDCKKLHDLISRPYVTGTPALMQQLQHMRQHGHKYGLEQMTSIRSDFLSTTFLPFCLTRGLFV